jgi:putative addiction module component (TIGR02574 family)
MQIAFEEIVANVRTLPVPQKEELARILMSDLDWDEDIKAAWLEEAKRRWDLYQSGELTASPINEVVSRVRAKISQ